MTARQVEPEWRGASAGTPLLLRAVLLTCLLALGAALGVALPHAYVTAATMGCCHADPSSAPLERVALVFGAGIGLDGLPSPMLADRVQAAVELYRARRVSKLLMSGDDSSIYHDEVDAMRTYAVERGVPAQDITLDYAGFSTYESCYRARAIFGVTQATLVTQDYHLPRAVYTCRELGIDAVGLGTPDWGRYDQALMVRLTLREALSTAKALWDVHITHPLPTFLGRYEGVK